jgi:hypothetical protein
MEMLQNPWELSRESVGRFRGYCRRWEKCP